MPSKEPTLPSSQCSCSQHISNIFLCSFLFSSLNHSSITAVWLLIKVTNDQHVAKSYRHFWIFLLCDPLSTGYNWPLSSSSLLDASSPLQCCDTTLPWMASSLPGDSPYLLLASLLLPCCNIGILQDSVLSPLLLWYSPYITFTFLLITDEYQIIAPTLTFCLGKRLILNCWLDLSTSSSDQHLKVNLLKENPKPLTLPTQPRYTSNPIPIQYHLTAPFSQTLHILPVHPQQSCWFYTKIYHQSVSICPLYYNHPSLRHFFTHTNDYDSLQNGFLHSCQSTVPSPMSARGIFLKCKSDHVIPQLKIL